MRLSVDTNLLVYTVDIRDRVKQKSAIQIVAALSRRDSVLTLQSLAEFRHVTARKRIAPPDTVRVQYTRLLDLFREPVAATLATLERALAGRDSGRFAFWDAMLLAAAAAAGCDAVISEDMGDGAVLDRVRVIAAFDAQGAVSPGARAALGMS